MRSHAAALLFLAGIVCAPGHAGAQTSADKAFVSGGKVDVHLDSGDYEVRPATDNHVRVSMTGRVGSATVDGVVGGSGGSARALVPTSDASSASSANRIGRP